MAVTANQRLVLLASILGSFVAFLDGSVVNVALPAMQSELGGGIATQQWIVDAYLLTLGSLILLAGSLSDLFGRKRVFAAGLLGFAVASLACAFAPTAPLLIVARGLQGMAGALLVPSSLAMIVGNFSGAGQAKAIGSWTAWTGVSFIAGPLLGGALVDAASWRWIFAINVVPVAATLVILARIAREPARGGDANVDWLGALTCVLGLGGVIFALIEQPRRGWHAPAIYLPLAGGALACVAFVVWERRARRPMLDFALFRNRNFAAGNAATVAIYAGLGGSTFLIAVFLQQVAGYSATAAGLALMPLTLLMFVLSPVAGRLAGRWGARWFMTAGPLLAAAGLALMATLDADIDYARDLLPGVSLLGLGLSTTVAPLTAAVLGGVDERHAGVGSAINNAVARVAGLLAVAAIGAIVVAAASGAHALTADAKQASVRAFGVAMASMAALLAIGGAVSAIGIRRPPSQDRAAARPAAPPSRVGG